MARKLITAILLVSMFLFLSGFINLGINLNSRERFVEPGGYAVYNISFYNPTMQTMDYFFDPDPQTDPQFSKLFDDITFSERVLRLAPEENKSVVIKIKLAEYAIPETAYTAVIYLKDAHDTRDAKRLDLDIVVAERTKTAKLAINDNYPISTTLENTIDIYVENMIKKSYDISVKLKSDLFNVEETANLGSLESKKIPIHIPDIQAEPIKYPFTLELYVHGIKIDEKNSTMEFLPFELIDETREYKKGFFSSTLEVTIQNKGTKVSQRQIKEKTTLFSRLITSSNYIPTIKSANEYVWVFNEIKPGDKVVLQITYNYLTYYITAIILVAILVAYYILKFMPVVKVFKTIEKNGNQLKVTVHVKNRSDFIVKNLRVIDKFPNMFHLKKTFGVQPTKIRNDKDYTRLMWEIGDIGIDQEIILYYEISEEVEVIGNIDFPEAKVQYNYKGVVGVKESSKLRLFFPDKYAIKPGDGIEKLK